MLTDGKAPAVQYDLEILNKKMFKIVLKSKFLQCFS